MTNEAPRKREYRFLKKRERWFQALAHESDLNATFRLIGISIASRMTEDQPYSWPSMAQIGRDIGCNHITAGRGVKALREAGWLNATNEKMGADKNREARGYTFTIKFPFED